MTDAASTFAEEVALAGRVADSAKRLQRADLAERLNAAAARTARPATIVCVVGEFKQGKSSLVNALLGRHVCPVDDDLATSALTLVRQGDEPSAEVRRRVDGEPVIEQVPIESIADWVTEGGNPDNAKDVDRVEVLVPSALLADGVCIVDTPGMGSMGAGHAAATLAFLPFADGLIFTSDASAELSEPEVDFLKRARELCPNVVVALTKIDLYPHWREIHALNAAHLARIGCDAPIVSLSSAMRWAAIERSDHELNDRSGYPLLLGRLHVSVIAPAKSVAATRAVQEACGALDQLRATVEGELAVIDDPARLATTIAQAEQAKSRLEHLRGPGSRWSTLVGDRIADLSNDVTFRFRADMRRISRSLEDSIELIAKPKEWDDLARVLQTDIADSVTDVFVRMDTGGAEINDAVVALIAEEALELPPLPTRAGEAIDVMTLWAAKPLDPATGQAGAALSSTLTGLRGAESGIVMFGMMGRFLPAGVGVLVMSNPVTLGMGAVFGGLQLLEAKKRKVAQRRQMARATVRQFVDDVQFEVGNQISDALRSIQQRALRDEFTERITELQRTYAQTAQQAQDTMNEDSAVQHARGTALRSELVSIVELIATADRLGCSPPVTVLDDVVALCDLADELTRGTTLAAEVPALRARLNGPLRIAIAGRVKAGKSTLLNALVGERLAATDAGECTLVVTWYREGIAYEVIAVRRDGSEQPLGFKRVDGALEVELGSVDVGAIDHIEVAWPSSALREVTLIDTPGLASLNDDNSVRTRDFLALDSDRSSDADAVIYLLRHLHRRDAEFLGSFMDRSVSASSPVNAVAVLSRADEIGACRLDALESASRIAARYRGDTQLHSLCTAIVPVAGLLAETGLTFREDEAAALRTLAGTPPDELALMLLAVDELCAPERSDLTIELRRQLLDRLGMFGIRLLLDAIQSGRVRTAADMARELVQRSGLAELRALIADHLIPRSQVLKARSALIGLRSIATRLVAADETVGRRLAAEIERVEISTPAFAELRLSHLVLSGEVAFTPDEVAELERLSSGGSIAHRLGIDGRLDGTVDGAAFDPVSATLVAVERWRSRGSDPLADSMTAEACATMAHAYEALYVEATTLT